MCEIPWQGHALVILMCEAQAHGAWGKNECAEVASTAEAIAVERGAEAVTAQDVRIAVEKLQDVQAIP